MEKKIEEETGKEKKKHNDSSENESSQKKKYIFVLIFFVFLFCIAYFIWLFLQTKVVGVIRSGTLPQKEEMFDENTQTKDFQGTYLRFSYEGKYQEISHSVSPTGPIKELVLLSSRDIEGRKIALTLEQRDSDSFDAVPSFQMRKNDTKTYQRTSFKWNGIDKVLFVKNTPVFEKTLFLQKKNSFLILSVSSPFSSEMLEEDIDRILLHLEWNTEKENIYRENKKNL